MLQLRPNCELCDRDLPPDATDAYICSYECTFCEDCAIRQLKNVCPNCGGGFSIRPIRPKTTRVEGTGLEFHPASNRRVSNKVPQHQRSALIEQLSRIPPDQR